MGHVLWLVPDTIITARLSLPIKGEEKQRTKKQGEKKTQGTKENTGRETRPQHQQSLLPESSLFPSFSSSPQPTKEHTSPSAFPSLFHPLIFKSKPATSGFPGFGDFGHRTPKPPTAFPSHQQPTIFPLSQPTSPSHQQPTIFPF